MLFRIRDAEIAFLKYILPMVNMAFVIGVAVISWYRLNI